MADARVLANIRIQLKDRTSCQAVPCVVRVQVTRLEGRKWYARALFFCLIENRVF
jgi:hypothetical protein